MSKTFRAWKINEPLFLPPTVQDFVAEDHLARFVLSLVRDDVAYSQPSGFGVAQSHSQSQRYLACRQGDQDVSQLVRRPGSEADWFRAVDDAGRFRDEWAGLALDFGWQPSDIFGQCGVAWFCAGERVRALGPDNAITASGRIFARLSLAAEIAKQEIT
jgi:hypothetical protein